MRYQRKLEKIATTDSLTRLFNRGKTIELLEARMNELPHKSNKCAVAMLDIDLFKTIVGPDSPYKWKNHASQ